MILGTTLRQGRFIASNSTANLIRRSFDSSRTTSFASQFSTSYHLLIEPTALIIAQQQRARSSKNFKTKTFWHSTPSHYDPPVRSLHQSYHASSSPLQYDSVKEVDPESNFYRALSPSLRSAIIEDLRSADLDNNGRIDANDLRTLLRKHNDSFTEEEVLELSELFYTSLGASSVDFHRFMEALDAAAAEEQRDEWGAIIKIKNNGEAILTEANGKFKTHPLGIGTCASEYMYAKTHGKYSEEDLNIELTHVPAVTFSDKTALFAVKCVRFAFDTATMWNIGSITKEKILNRAIFLETIAAIPGMVAAIIRHFRSLRNMARDGGMLNMFLEEANNERMHLLTFIRMKEPGYLFRAAVIGAQFGFGSFFLTAYVINPTWCHRFVGYIEEEACQTYTKILKEMDDAPSGSDLAEWGADDAPKIAKGYWHLGERGTVYDVMQVVRADEAEHRDVNHAVSGVPEDTVNPMYDPRVKLDEMLKKYVKDIMEKEVSKQANVT
eukprot:CAMPEP_0172528588 /NCGR_PEP_ID=MMETSP1067-20121228/2939_1 /TAXON_ID=265564 ORGANISM="Thalassiosira punctigera, Strain Tpunct2005C2" /NCGR_SAMPLE_ID=MMETSP1067 /ASSEMBLY_ACC=CAM_ASM_000444 /LENGTH=495 /DNA_ID=CAMNT_0013312529 /DNA_START=21 /DNA_END=1508 /DNA_ORIENTATION=-